MDHPPAPQPFPHKVNSSTSYHTRPPQTSTYPLHMDRNSLEKFDKWRFTEAFIWRQRSRLDCAPLSKSSFKNKGESLLCHPRLFAQQPPSASLVLTLLARPPWLRPHLPLALLYQVERSLSSWESVNFICKKRSRSRSLFYIKCVPLSVTESRQFLKCCPE